MPQMISNPIPTLIDWRKEYGDIYQLARGNTGGIVICEPNYVQQVLQKKHRLIEKSIIQSKLLARYVGKGLLTSTGNYWLQQRRAIQPGFHKQRLQGISTTMVNEIETFSEVLNDIAQKDKPVNLSKLMMEISFKVIGRSLFGEDQLDENLAFIGHVVAVVQAHVIRTIRTPFLNKPREYLGVNQKYLDLIKQSDRIIYEVIEKRKSGKIAKDDLLTMLMEVTYSDTGKGMTLTQLRDEALILFVAGFETTANALTWLWYLLDKHPKVVEKLQQEAKTVLQNGKPVFEDIQKLTYTKQVIQETMRLYPPAWSTDRVVLEDFEIDGYPIKKGNVVIPFIYGIHRHEAYWENASAFKPERFSKEQVAKRPPFAYFPFGGGPRLCIGNQFAMMEMQFLVAMLVTQFRFSLAQNHEPELQPMITLSPKGGLLMKVSKLN